jgi:hypothetical protein
MHIIIGREKEIKFFENLISAKQAEFVAVYGRRRIGKTFLIQNCCSHTDIYFEITGIKDGHLKDQLHNFIRKFEQIFYPTIPLSLKTPATWGDAFRLLTEQLKNVPKSKNIILFFDELPWLSSRKSNFMQNLDYFWNTEWSHFENLKLIVCGSAASWMLNNLINAKGGLHNRLTKSLLLKPFTLLETKSFLIHKGFALSNSHVLEIYMVMGGVPHYLNALDSSKSVIQNINDICFQQDGLLFDEFTRLFKSLFDASHMNLLIVKEMAKSRYGISLADLTERTGKKAGGRFQERLEELESTGFIQKFLPFGRAKRDSFYKVIDEYSIFYLKWISNLHNEIKIVNKEDYYSKIIHSASWHAWSGYAFENICYKHINKITRALDLDHVGCHISHWKYNASPLNMKDNGAEIDLLLDRDDNAITLCEIKYTSNPFVIDKNFAKNIMQKTDVFQLQTKTKKQIFTALISASGVTKSAWTDDVIQKIVTADDLFSV